jgi:hypothetical protein
MKRAGSRQTPTQSVKFRVCIFVEVCVTNAEDVYYSE